MKMNFKIPKKKTQQRRIPMKKHQPYKSVKTTVQHINYTQQVSYPQYDFDQISNSIDLMNQKKQQTRKQRSYSQKSKQSSNLPHSFQLTSAQIVRKINMMRMECQEKEFVGKKKPKHKNPYVKKPKKPKQSQFQKQKINKFSYISVVPIDKISLNQSVRYFDQSSSESRYNFVIRQKNKTIVQTELQDFISPEQIIQFQKQKISSKKRRTSTISQQQPWQSYQNTMMLLARHLSPQQDLNQQASRGGSIQQSSKPSSVNEKYIKSEEYPFRDRRPQKKQYAIQTESSPPLKKYKIQQMNRSSVKAKRSKQKVQRTEKIKTEQTEKWEQFALIVNRIKDRQCGKLDFLVQLQNIVLQNVNQLESQISFQLQKSPKKQQKNTFQPSNQKCDTFQNASGNSQQFSAEQFNSRKYIDYLQGQINDYEKQHSSDQSQEFKQNYIKFNDTIKKYEPSNVGIQRQRKQLDTDPFRSLHLNKISSDNSQQKKQKLYSQQFQEDTQLFIRTTNSGKFVIQSQDNFIQSQHKDTQFEAQENDQKDERIKPYQSKNKQIGKSQNEEDFSEQSQDLNDQKIGIQRVQRVAVMIFNGLLFEAFKQLTDRKDFIFKFKLKAYEIKQRIEKLKSIKKGFKTDQGQIKLFIQELSHNLLQNYQHILKKLQKPRGPTGLQILRYMHEGDDIQDSQDDQNVIIIPNQIFELFWGKKQKKISENFSILQKQEPAKLQYYKYLYQIFYRSLFDCFNECLQMQRNFGQFGQSFPWKSAPVFSHQLQTEDLKKKIVKAKKKLFDLSSTYCGIIVDKHELKQLGDSQVYIDQVKQDRLIKMLKKDIVDEDLRWMFYDDEQVQVLVEISHMISLQLIEEGLTQINQIFQQELVDGNQ